MPNRLANKTAVITGASSGIGRAIALLFAREGAKVICSDLQQVSLDKESEEQEIATHDLITQEGGEAIYVRADVTIAKDIEELVQECVTRWGRLDIMINNAGIALEAENPAPIWDHPEGYLDKTMAVNVKGVFLGCKYASAQMMKQEPHPCGDRGWIVNLSSVYGLRGGAKISSYVASKHAVMGLTKCVALDCAPNRIHVNALNPGYCETQQPGPQLKDPSVRARLDARHPFRGLGQPEDIAKAALFLASEDNSWCTGIGIPVDGGYSAI